MGLKMCGMCGFQKKPPIYFQDNQGTPKVNPRSGGGLSDLETSDLETPIPFWDNDHRTHRSKRNSVDVHSLKPVAARQTRRQVTSNSMNELLMDVKEYSISATSSFCPMCKKVSATTSYVPLPMSKVLSTLYIGTYDDSTNEEDLRQRGITHILTLVGNQSCFKWVNYKQYVMSDYGKTNIKDVLSKVYEFMKEGQKGNNKLLVHCQSGQNRSAVVIISFLMKNDKKTLYRAHRELRRVRPIVQVHVEYAKQLLEFEKELLGENSLPTNWMERHFDVATEELTYKHEDMETKRHRLAMSQQT
jgi:protein-tyrosine phosphatase